MENPLKVGETLTLTLRNREGEVVEIGLKDIDFFNGAVVGLDILRLSLVKCRTLMDDKVPKTEN